MSASRKKRIRWTSLAPSKTPLRVEKKSSIKHATNLHVKTAGKSGWKPLLKSEKNISLSKKKKQSEYKRKLNDNRIELLKERGNLRNKLYESPEDCSSLGLDDELPTDDEPVLQDKKTIKFIHGGTLKEEAPDLCLVAYALEDNNSLKADDEYKYEEEEAYAAAEPNDEDPFADQDIDNNFLPPGRWSPRGRTGRRATRTGWSRPTSPGTSSGA